MEMKNPPHVGDVVQYEILEPLNLTITAAARVLGVSRPALSKLVNGRASLSPEMAVRIEKAFGPRMEHLMRMQHAHDLAEVRSKADRIHVDRYRPA
jgi:addiction module HigA family antidote